MYISGTCLRPPKWLCSNRFELPQKHCSGHSGQRLCMCLDVMRHHLKVIGIANTAESLCALAQRESWVRLQVRRQRSSCRATSPSHYDLREVDDLYRLCSLRTDSPVLIREHLFPSGHPDREFVIDGLADHSFLLEFVRLDGLAEVQRPRTASSFAESLRSRKPLERVKPRAAWQPVLLVISCGQTRSAHSDCCHQSISDFGMPSTGRVTIHKFLPGHEFGVLCPPGGESNLTPTSV